MQEKHERMKKLKNLRETESKFCNQMCLPAHNLGDVNVPTKEQLKELEANVEYLQKEHVSGVMSLIDLGNSCFGTGRKGFAKWMCHSQKNFTFSVNQLNEKRNILLIRL